MREFRLKKPGSDESEGEDIQSAADAIMRRWEEEEARNAYLSTAGMGPATLGFASVVMLLALTLAVTLGLRLGMAVLAVGLVLSPIALGWLRTAIVSADRLKRLEKESRD